MVTHSQCPISRGTASNEIALTSVSATLGYPRILWLNMVDHLVDHHLPHSSSTYLGYPWVSWYRRILQVFPPGTHHGLAKQLQGFATSIGCPLLGWRVPWLPVMDSIAKGTLVPYFWPYELWGYPLKFSPYTSIGLIFARYLQFRFLKWPLMWNQI